LTRPWPRENYTLGGGDAQVALIALSSAKLPDPLPVSRKAHGMPDSGAGASAIAIVARDRAEDPAWFTEHVLSPFTELIASDLGVDAAATAFASEHAYVIEAGIADPDDLGHVQAAWALAKCVCEEGAAVVIDVYAARAHLGSEIAALSPERAFDVMHEVTFFFEETGPERVAAWSLGLRKFGRPDLVLLDIEAPAATEAALLLRDISAALANGERIEPGDIVSGGDSVQLEVVRFAPDMEQAVAVDGPAILLRRIDAKA
jgi:hypothetical protein